MRANPRKQGRRKAHGDLGTILTLVMLVFAVGCAGLPLAQQTSGQPYQEDWKAGIRNPWFCHGLLYYDKPLGSRTGNEPTLESLVLFGEGLESAQVKVVLFASQRVPGEKTFNYLMYHYPNPLQLPNLQEHWRVRSRSPSHQPMVSKGGKGNVWCVLSGRYPLKGTWQSDRPHSQGLLAVSPPRTLLQLEFYESDPTAGYTLPARIWVVGEVADQPNMYQDGVWSLGGSLFTITDLRVGNDFNLEKLEMSVWAPPAPEVILAGQRIKAEAETLLAVNKANNQRLLEWKTKELPEALRGYSTAQAQDLVVKLESALLDIDSRIKKTKEAQDEAARYLPQPGQAQQAPPQVPQWQVEQAHLFSQRKAIALACLEMVKRTLAQRR